MKTLSQLVEDLKVAGCKSISCMNAISKYYESSFSEYETTFRVFLEIETGLHTEKRGSAIHLITESGMSLGATEITYYSTLGMIQPFSSNSGAFMSQEFHDTLKTKFEKLHPELSIDNVKTALEKHNQ